MSRIAMTSQARQATSRLGRAAPRRARRTSRSRSARWLSKSITRFKSSMVVSYVKLHTELLMTNYDNSMSGGGFFNIVRQKLHLSTGNIQLLYHGLQIIEVGMNFRAQPLV